MHQCSILTAWVVHIKSNSNSVACISVKRKKNIMRKMITIKDREVLTTVKFMTFKIQMVKARLTIMVTRRRRMKK